MNAAPVFPVFLAVLSSAFSQVVQTPKVLLARPGPAAASGSPALLTSLARLALG